jgi:hypothetical protein
MEILLRLSIEADGNGKSCILTMMMLGTSFKTIVQLLHDHSI